ncbi:MAG TPA: ABC transporter permease subunit [Quisquiliibacterium sp.]|mgnify:CR=1 FL=1|nr:ABC transporter permease subunit [Quisquiliibacterium sp.]
MKGLGAVVQKELREYFATPIALVVVATFWALCGYLFSFALFFVSTTQMVGSFHNMMILLLLVMPLLTMRIFAEENKTGTMELLLSLPLAEWQIVAAKFGAAFVMLLVMLAGTATAVVPLVLYAQPDLGPILGGYLGITLLGAAFMGVGIFVSSLTSNQIVAALLTWGALTLLWFADYASALDAVPGLRGLFLHLSFSVHYVDVIRGVLNGGTVVYFVSVLVVALALTTLGLKARRA